MKTYEIPLNSVHPRLRGELRRITINIVLSNGSSPLTRGTREILRNTLADARFIPAYAGNSDQSALSGGNETVHPRLRGELGSLCFAHAASCGSSPLTRGTRAGSTPLEARKRFIPAYAGNSLKQGIEHLTNSSKDFLSGKYAKNPETVLNHFKNRSLD